MLRSRVHVNLPSHETQRGKSALEWVRSAFGAKLDLRSGREELTVSAFSVVEGLVEAFTRAGVSDVISFIVDKKVVYLDSREIGDDLPLVQEAAEQKGIFGRGFGEMHLVLSHRADGLHTLLDVRIRNQVLLGEDEMSIDLSSRVESLRVQPGESAEAYAARVQTFVADPGALEPQRLRLEALSARVADALRTALVGARVTADAAEVTIIRPGKHQIARFRDLPFGSEVDAPHYRPVPTHQRAGAYADPFFYYYHDPYYDFMSFMMVSSLIHSVHGSAWHASHMHVVDPSGHQVASGGDLSAAGDGWVGRDAVSFDDSGRPQVDQSIPESAAETSSWQGAESAPSAGAEDHGGDGWGGDSGGAESTDSGSSSCGSSCSSSSCGSSCGGGSD